MDVSRYREELERYAADLASIADVSVCGEGAAQFIYATALPRAVEIARSREGVWVELWLEDEPSREETHESFPEAMAAARAWLAGAGRSDFGGTVG